MGLCYSSLNAKQNMTENRGPLPGDENVSVEWLNALLHEKNVIGDDVNVSTAEVQDLKGNRGLSGAISRVVLSYDKESEDLPKSLILKMMPANRRRKDTEREALFYLSDFAKELKDNIPDVLYAHGDPETNDNVILMRDLQETSNSTNLNFLLGNQIWGLPEGALDKLDPVPEKLDVLKEMFLTAANWHAKNWNNEELKKQNWLRVVPWMNGEEKEWWEKGFTQIKTFWENAKKKIESGDIKVNYTDKLVGLVDKSLENASWEGLQEYLNSPDVFFTLCHGDFHASNMMWMNDTSSVRLFDWSEIGLREPGCDLGQTIISDVRPEVWKNGEDIKLLKIYWEKLVSMGVPADEFTFEKCVEGYERSTIEYWFWMFIILHNFPIPPSLLQYFHDQLLAFIEEHPREYTMRILVPL